MRPRLPPSGSSCSARGRVHRTASTTAPNTAGRTHARGGAGGRRRTWLSLGIVATARAAAATAAVTGAQPTWDWTANEEAKTATGRKAGRPAATPPQARRPRPKGRTAIVGFEVEKRPGGPNQATKD